MSDNNIKVIISGEDKLSPTMEKAIQNASKLNAGLVSLSAGLQVVKNASEIAHKAFEFLERYIHKAVEEALEAEKAQNQLIGALVATGKYSRQAAEDIDQYAKSVQESTGINDDWVKSHVAIGIQLGLSVQKAKEMEEAARKLSVATGKDLDTAFQMLQGSMAGHARQLALQVPAVKNLTAAQLKSGEAIKLVSQALDAQYRMYQGSFDQSLQKAKNSINEVYKAFGNMIIQSPIVIKAVGMFTDFMLSLEHRVKEVDKWIKTHSEEISRFGVALGSALKIAAVALGVWAVAAAAATIPTMSLAGAIAVLTSPITVTAAAVAALTAAFYKWPGLFDVIAGAVKTLVAAALIPLSTALQVTLRGIGLFVGALNKEWGKSITGAADKLLELHKSLAVTGIEQAKAGVESIKTGQAVEKATAAVEDHTKATEKDLTTQNNHNKMLREKQKIYGEIAIGTDATRLALERDISTRDQDLRHFQAYLEAKTRLAVSEEAEQAMEVNKARANLLKGTGGSGEAAATAQLAVDAERKKQADLAAARQMGLINEQTYAQASLQSLYAQQTAELQATQAHAKAKADLLGTSEEGFQQRQAIEEEQFKVRLQQRMLQAELEGATEAEINAMKAAAYQDHLADMEAKKTEFITHQMENDEKMHNSWGVSLGKIRLAQQQHGKVLGAIMGAQQTQEYQASQQFMGNLASLRNTHSKKAFELGKKAALAQATVNTFMAATSAYAAMAGIPFVGPVLGALAAAAAIAAGFANIQQINSQEFQGGQADSGMDSIPQSLAGRSFVLSAGERVVQPTANRDLTDFLNKQKVGGGPSGGPTVVNITINGIPSKDDQRKAVDTMIEELRRASERGQPIISERGIIKNGG